jgi:hypothetical protein
MKKFFLSAIMLTAAITLFAQDPTIEKIKVKEDKTKVKYSDDTKVVYQAADAVPLTIRTHFMTINPDVTEVTWEPMDEWWYATYTNDNNRIVRVYYNTQPWYLERNESYIVALPVLNTYVPEEVITSAIDSYGNSLYSITALRSTDTENVYQVMLIKNGMSESVLMDEKGVVFTDVEKIRTTEL